MIEFHHTPESPVDPPPQEPRSDAESEMLPRPTIVEVLDRFQFFLDSESVRTSCDPGQPEFSCGEALYHAYRNAQRALYDALPEWVTLDALSPGERSGILAQFGERIAAFATAATADREERATFLAHLVTVSESEEESALALTLFDALEILSECRWSLLMNAAEFHGPWIVREHWSVYDASGIAEEALLRATLSKEPTGAAVLGALDEINPSHHAEILTRVVRVFPMEVLTLVLHRADVNDALRMQLVLTVIADEPNRLGEILPLFPQLSLSALDRLACLLHIAHADPIRLLAHRRTAEHLLRIAAEATLTLDDREGIARDLLERDVRLFSLVVHAFALPESSIRSIVRDYPETLQQELFTMLGVPNRNTPSIISESPPPPDTADDRWWAMFAKEWREATETALESTARSSSVALSEAIAAAYAESDRARVRMTEQEELLGAVAQWAPMTRRGANAPLFFTFQGRDLPAVYKPQRRDHESLRSGIRPWTYAVREWIAFEIDRALQLHVVPPTILRRGPEGLGSVQAWRIGRTWVEEPMKERVRASDLAGIALLDVLINNTDRHEQNMLVSTDAHAYAIDNGLCFSTDARDALRSEALAAMSGTKISEGLRERIAAFEAAPVVQAALREVFTVALGNDAESHWQAFRERLAGVAAQSTFDPDYVMPW